MDLTIAVHYTRRLHTTTTQNLQLLSMLRKSYNNSMNYTVIFVNTGLMFVQYGSIKMHEIKAEFMRIDPIRQTP